MRDRGAEASPTLAASAAAALAVAGMLFASRLPATLDFMLPRRFGFGLFSLAHGLLSRPGPSLAFTAAVALVFAAAAARAGAAAVAAAREVRWSPAEFLLRGLRVALAVLLFRWSCAMWLEISLKVLFPYGSMNAAEPLFHAAAFFVLFAALSSAVVAFLSVREAPVARVLVAWTGANLIAAVLGFGFFNAWTGGVAREPASRRLYLVLVEEEGRPGRVAYDMPYETDRARIDSLERLALAGGVQRLEALRALYEIRAKSLDPEGLRRDLRLGVAAGDGLARSLLLDHLSAAAPSPEALRALDELADERLFRIGPVAAARIARAYALLGAPERAESWAGKASEGASGVARGLIELPRGGALTPGRVAGRVTGARPERVALYRKPDPAAPYLLDAGALVASVAPDGSGRFSFTGLPAGRFYLAFAYPAGNPAAGEPRVSGHRGDAVLDARRPAVELPPVSVSFAAR